MLSWWLRSPLPELEHLPWERKGKKMPDELSRDARVLLYLLQIAPGIGHTLLAKFVYLADLESRRYRGVPISSFTYIYDDFGPFDSRRFYKALSELTNKGFVADNQVSCGQYAAHDLRPLKSTYDDFTVEEQEVLSYVGETYLNMSARYVCEEVVYKTEPMLQASPKENVPMHIVDNAARKHSGFSLSSMLAGEADVEAGRSQPLADVMNELRAQNH